eukprot:gene23981-32387_t
MLWNQSDRFKKTKDSYRKSFTNIAEYIRHQIQLTKPKFQTIDFWTEQALINESRRAKIPSVFPESAPSSSSVKPAEPETDDDIFITAPKFDEKLSKKPGAAAISQEKLSKQRETIARLTKPFKKLNGSKRSNKYKLNTKDNDKGVTKQDSTSNAWLKPTFNRKHHELKYMSKSKSLLRFENPPFDEGERKKDDKMVKAFQNYKNSLPSSHETDVDAAGSPQTKTGNNIKLHSRAPTYKANPAFANKRYPPQPDDLPGQWKSVASHSYKWHGRKMKIIIS